MSCASYGLPAPGDPPGVRLRGSSDVALDVDTAIRARDDVAATPTGPVFVAGYDPHYVGLVTILAQLDRDVIATATGDVPKIPGVEIPEGAVS